MFTEVLNSLYNGVLVMEASNVCTAGRLTLLQKHRSRSIPEYRDKNSNTWSPLAQPGFGSILAVNALVLSQAVQTKKVVSAGALVSLRTGAQSQEHNRALRH